MLLTKDFCRRNQVRFVAGLETTEEFKIFNALIQQQDASPSDTVQKILSLTKDALRANEQNDQALGRHLECTSNCLLEVAARTSPDQQKKLIAVLEELQNTTVTDPKTGDAVRYQDGVVWADLPTVGIAFAEEMGSFDPLDTTNWPEENARWEPLTTFAAQVTAAPGVMFDMACSWAMTAMSYVFGPRDEPFVPTDLAVRAACLWLVYVGDMLWELARKGEFAAIDEEEELKVEKSLEQWNGWKTDFQKLRYSVKGTRTRELVVEALGVMERVEGTKN